MAITADMSGASPADIKLLNQMSNVWGMDPTIAAVAKNSAGVYKYKHGMFASAPIICQADKCPYKGVCQVDPMYRIVGSRCPQEAGVIL